MPIENNPEIEDSSEEEIGVQYKKKPVIKKQLVRKPKVNKDIDEMKESIKKLENLAISKQKNKRDTSPPPPPPSAPASISNSTKIPRKKQRRIRQIIYSESEDEEESTKEIIQQVQKIEPEPVSPIPRPPPVAKQIPRRRFKFKS
tara:strand:- start:6520 stop:6954 length:435 start_codon:yes stop_codon:yes gene_type:complete